MAAKIAVLESHQDLADKPIRHVKRSVAACLVRRALAIQVSKRLIQMVALREVMQSMSRPEIIEVPSILPPRPPDWAFTAYPLPDQRTIYA